MDQASAPKLTFDQFIRHWAQERGDNVALEEGDDALTFGQLEQRSRQIIAMLKANGVGKGDRIAWLGKNARHYFELFYSAARAGVVTVPIGWRLAAPEIAYILQDTGAKILFTGEGFGELADKSCSQLETPPRVMGQSEALAAIEQAPADNFDAAGPLDAVLQLYTSGTTGIPRARC